MAVRFKKKIDEESREKMSSVKIDLIDRREEQGQGRAGQGQGRGRGSFFSVRLIKPKLLPFHLNKNKKN